MYSDAVIMMYSRYCVIVNLFRVGNLSSFAVQVDGGSEHAIRNRGRTDNNVASVQSLAAFRVRFARETTCKTNYLTRTCT